MRTNELSNGFISEAEDARLVSRYARHRIMGPHPPKPLGNQKRNPKNIFFLSLSVRTNLKHGTIINFKRHIQTRCFTHSLKNEVLV